MTAYEQGAHAYRTAMPTDGLRNFRDVMFETKELGSSEWKQHELGKQVRNLLQEYGYPSVAGVGYEAPVWLSPIPLILTLKMAANSKRKDFR